jgi:hypothetical protein
MRHLKKFLAFFLLTVQLASASFDAVHPSLHYIDKAPRGYDAHVTQLPNYEANKDYLFAIMQNEQEGFFGYHGSTRGFRIYQDVIRIGIEEVLGIPIRENFHFMRIPGDRQLTREESALAFLRNHPTPYDLAPDQQRKLLSLQIALHSECEYDSGSCSPYYFLQNSSLTEQSFEKHLRPFFELLGIDQRHIRGAIDIGMKNLPNDRGILIQFFDISQQEDPLKKPYNFVDKHGYPSQPLGVPFTAYLSLPSLYITHKDLDRYPQLRLVMSNRYTLNPNSPIMMMRLDNIDEGIVYNYEQKLRQYFRSLKADPVKKEAYRKALLAYWSK